MINTTDSVVLR